MKHTKEKLRPLLDPTYSKYYDQPNVLNSDTEYFFEMSEKDREPTTRMRSKLIKKNGKKKVKKLVEETTTATDIEAYCDDETPDIVATTDINMESNNEKWTTNINYFINLSTLRSKHTNSYENGLIEDEASFTKYSPMTKEAFYNIESDEVIQTCEITEKSETVHPTFRIESFEEGIKHIIGGKSTKRRSHVKTTTNTESYSYEEEDEDYPDDDSYNYDADVEYNAMKEDNPDSLLVESVKSNKGHPTTCRMTFNHRKMMDEIYSRLYNKMSTCSRLEYTGIINYTDDPAEESSNVQNDGNSVKSCSNCKTYFAVCKNLLEALEKCGGASSAISKVIPMAGHVTTSAVTTSHITSEALTCTSIASTLPLVLSTGVQTTLSGNKTTAVSVTDKLTSLEPGRNKNSDSTSRTELLESTTQHICSCGHTTTTVEGGKQSKDKSLQEPKEQSGNAGGCNITSLLQSVCSLLNDSLGCEEKVHKIHTERPNAEQFTRRFIRLHPHHNKNDSHVPNGFRGNITIINNTCNCQKNGFSRIIMTKSDNGTTPMTCAGNSIGLPVTKVFHNRQPQGRVHPIDIIRYLHIHNPNSTEVHKKRKKKIYIIRANNLGRGSNFLNYVPIRKQTARGTRK